MHYCVQHMSICFLMFAFELGIRDWSLNTGRGGGATKWEGGHVNFYPYENGGGGGVSHAERGGGTTSFEVVFTP